MGNHIMSTDRIRKLIEGVRAKRPRTVLEHILEHGHVTSEELRDLYGYDHPPRAAGDVREHGIPLRTTSIRGKTGRLIASYSLGDDSDLDDRKAGGRRAFSKALKTALVARDGEICSLCGARFPARALQIDHRVPYAVSGDNTASTLDSSAFMLVCGSCNRSKSWSCEHCVNLLDLKDGKNCRGCYWASPESYSHMAMEPRRIIHLSWVGDDSSLYDKVSEAAAVAGLTVEDYVKLIVQLAVDQ